MSSSLTSASAAAGSAAARKPRPRSAASARTAAGGSQDRLGHHRQHRDGRGAWLPALPGVVARGLRDIYERARWRRPRVMHRGEIQRRRANARSSPAASPSSMAFSGVLPLASGPRPQGRTRRRDLAAQTCSSPRQAREGGDRQGEGGRSTSPSRSPSATSRSYAPSLQHAEGSRPASSRSTLASTGPLQAPG